MAGRSMARIFEVNIQESLKWSERIDLEYVTSLIWLHFCEIKGFEKVINNHYS